MSRPKKDRRQLIDALNLAMRDASGSGVLFSSAVAARLGIASSDLECLDYVVRGPKTAGELARATGLTTGAITGVIDRLERAGFVRREADPDDRRKVVVKPLAAVKDRVMPLFAPMERAQMAALRSFSDQELAFLLDFFLRAHEAARAAMEEVKAPCVRQTLRRVPGDKAEFRTKTRKDQ